MRIGIAEKAMKQEGIAGVVMLTANPYSDSDSCVLTFQLHNASFAQFC